MVILMLYIHACNEVQASPFSNASVYSAQALSDDRSSFSREKSTSHKFKSLSIYQKQKQPKVIPNKRITRSTKDYVLVDGQLFTCTKQTTETLLCNSRCRFVKKNQAMQQKMKQYFKTYLQHVKYKQISHRIMQEKLQLYRVLQAQCGFDLTNLMRTAVQCLQQKYELMVQAHPQHGHILVKWKNTKLHELVSAHTFLSQATLQLSEREDKCPPPLLYRSDDSQEVYIKCFLSLLLQYWNEEYGYQENQHCEKKENVPLTTETISKNTRDVLTDDIFVSFSKEKQEILLRTFFHQQEEEDNYMHVYNKAIFDSLDDRIRKMHPNKTPTMKLQTAVDEILRQLNQKQSSYYSLKSLANIQHYFDEIEDIYFQQETPKANSHRFAYQIALSIQSLLLEQFISQLISLSKIKRKHI